MNQAPHTLDLLCHLAGPPATVWGASRRRSQPMEAEDTATALLEYGNGAVGTVAVSTTEPGVQRIELVGDRGRIEIVGETLTFERFEPPLSEHLPTCDGDVRPADARARERRASRRAGRPPRRAPGLRGGDPHGQACRVRRRATRVWSLEVANAIVLSTHTGQAVPLPVDRAAYAALLADLRAGRLATPGL